MHQLTTIVLLFTPPSAAFTSFLHLGQRRQFELSELATSIDVAVAPSSPDATIYVDRRPHEQRVDGPRKARRLNHAFQHLYRHSDPSFLDNDWGKANHAANTTTAPASSANNHVDVRDGITASISDEVYEFYRKTFDDRTAEVNSTFAQQSLDASTALGAIQYLHTHGGYALDEIDALRSRFPPLLEMDVVRHLRPKMRFLKGCMGGGHGSDQVLHPTLRASLPPGFFGSRLERTVAPRHAFLVHVGLPFGKELWDGGVGDGALLGEFVAQHRKPKQFAALCNKWRSAYGSDSNLPITSEQVVAFDKLFQRGILSAAREDFGCDHSDGESSVPTPLETANATAAQLVRYLLHAGANPYETDVRGASLFHWAAGCGNLEGLRELVAACGDKGRKAALLWTASRDDATPLHWAAAGAGPKSFGIGGHLSVCNFLLSISEDMRKLINSQTRDGNSVLMWAAWSRSLDVVKMLVRSRADTEVSNRNGCTVAHWAASGGDLEVCKYLHSIAHVDFTVENHARNTPLSHAVAYGRYDVVKWLKEDLCVEDTGSAAEGLALDFFTWANDGYVAEEDEAGRKDIHLLFNTVSDWESEGFAND